MFCSVRKCRFAGSHVTTAHVCGRCGQLGHGILECGRCDPPPCSYVRLPDPSMWCTAPGCATREMHTLQAHVCATCSQRGGGCLCHKISVLCPHCKTVSAEVDLTKPVYTGADCSICMESAPAVLFPECGHANVCAFCAKRLPSRHLEYL